MNGLYNNWIADKLTIRYMLQPFAEYLPENYYQVSKMGILRLMDCPGGFNATIEDIFRLLRN